MNSIDDSAQSTICAAHEPPPPPPSFQMHGKNVVRISPALLGRVGQTAASVTEGSLIVQFVGKCIKYNEDAEWNVTQAILSNSLAVSSQESRAQRNEQVDEVMRQQQLTHVGWLRQASASCPLSTLDLDTQRVYEGHLPDAFAAMLDMSQSESGPVVYFYCLSNPHAEPHDASYNAFAAAHHVVLDTSIPFDVVEVSLGGSLRTGRTAADERRAAQKQKAGPQHGSVLQPGSDNSSDGADDGTSRAAPAGKPQPGITRDTYTTSGTADTQQTMHIDSALQAGDESMSLGAF